MLLSIATTHAPATDLGFLLHKHPDKLQSFSLSFGQAHVFYDAAEPGHCRANLLLDVDPVGVVRGTGKSEGLLDQYVNDRPYVASSFMSVAISQVFGSALNARCETRPELAQLPLPLEVKLTALPVRGGESFLRSVFEPLGYTVEAENAPLDETMPEWGLAPCLNIMLRHNLLLAQLLRHLYVLIPVFDNRKHYYVGYDEIDKLLAKGEGWLPAHPLKEQITRRYLRNQPSLFREALDRLLADDEPLDSQQEKASSGDQNEAGLESPLSLHDQRLAAVMAAIKASGARSVVDLGCGEGKLLKELIRDHSFQRILGMDVSVRALEVAAERLKLERMTERQAERIKLIHGSLIYRDARIAGFDAAAVVEVIEHLDPPRLQAFEQVLFHHARPRLIALTTPNREYNTLFETLPPGRFRHTDHRFEWSRDEFQTWANAIAMREGYQVTFQPLGPVHPALGAPSQMALFELADAPRPGHLQKETTEPAPAAPPETF